MVVIKFGSSLKTAGKALWQMRARGRPFVLSHGINNHCNLRCEFCNYWQNQGSQMSTQEIFALLNEARSFGIGVYNAWTVEPLLRLDLPKILAHAKDLDMTTSLVTNGRLLGKRVKELSDLDYLSVSLDGFKSYKELRGADPDLTIKGLKIAKEAGHNILINCVISRKNIDELEDLVHLAEYMGVSISFEPLHESQDIEDKVWENLRIKDLSKYEKVIDRLLDLKQAGAPIINSETYLSMIRSRKPNFHCHADKIILHITSDGTIQNCRVHRKPLGHISQGLTHVWEKSAIKRKNIVRDCRGCLFFGYAENSLLYEFVPEVMAHYKWM